MARLGWLPSSPDNVVPPDWVQFIAESRTLVTTLDGLIAAAAIDYSELSLYAHRSVWLKLKHGIDQVANRPYAIRDPQRDCWRSPQGFMDAAEIVWPAPGSEDTELRCLMEQEAGHGETAIYARVQG